MLRCFISVAAGAILACAFAPLEWWPFAILSPAVLIYLWQGAKPREAVWLGFWFNFGTFAAGTYWLYVSIHIFGGAPIWLALALMIALVAIMALYHAVLGYAVARWLPKAGPLRWIVGIPAAWTLIEWWRGWFLSGFSWLSLGYSQTDTWLAHYSPVTGVYGITAILLMSAGAVVTLVLGKSKERMGAVGVLITPWLLAAAIKNIEWTQPAGNAISVAIVQGAIPQDQKWQDKNLDTTLRRYREMTEQALGTQLIVWPESAVPDLASNQVDYLRELYSVTRTHGSALVTGILRVDENERYFNSILALGDDITWYDKDHLVPFAEFFPVPKFVRSWLRLMSLPYGDFTRGGEEQPPLPAGRLKLAATVCYEDAYGSSQRDVLHTADALVNVTNDAWFGHSTARHQHLQISRMRAIEAGRPMIRAANDGISAFIGPHGEILARAPEFTPAVLHATVTPRKGLPPYVFVGNSLITLLAALALAVAVGRRNH